MPRVTPEFGGKYCVVAENEGGKAESSASVNIIDPSTPPRFVKDVSDTSAFEGESTFLEVIVSGTPKPIVEWYKDGEKLFTKIDSKNDDNRWRLTFQSLKEEDGGEYYCVARNKVGQATSQTAYLDVKRGGQQGQPPRFVKVLNDLDVEMDESVTMEVQIEGTPIPDVKWFHNGREIIAGDEYILSADDSKGIYRLQIPKVTSNLVGKYTVGAANSGGKVESSGSLNVRSAPRISQRLGDIEADVGDEMVDFTVKIDGSPSPNVRWLHNGEEISPNNKNFEIIAGKDNKTYTLRIPKVYGDLGGKYSVVAENDEGKSESSASLFINCTPVFTQKLKNITANPKDEVRMKVKYNGFPEPEIKWYKDGVEIFPDRKRIRIIEEEPFSATLIISSCDLSDVGTYKCVATNSSGTASTESKLMVSSKPVVKREMTNLNLMNGTMPKMKQGELEDFRHKMYNDPFNFRSESKYQTGPDTYVLQYRDTDFPLRVREYLRVGVHRSPTLANQLQQGHWGDANIGYGFSPQVSIRERRRFVDVMDEEIDDEKRGLDTRTTPMRLIREVGTPGYAYGQIHHLRQEASSQLGKPMPRMQPPYYREKIKDIAVKEEEEAVFSCYAVGIPNPSYTWFRNDGILMESSRITITTTSSGRCELKIHPVKAYDVGCYKCVARNDCGAVFCRARLKMGSAPGIPDPPIIKQTTDTQVHLCWIAPKFTGNDTISCYLLECKQISATSWTQVADNITDEFFVVHDLQPSASYVFRLKACNKFGWSEFSFQSQIADTQNAGSDSKIVLSRCQAFRQKKTESGAVVTNGVVNGNVEDHLDYSRESNGVELSKGEHSELYNFVSEITRGRFSIVTKAFVKELGSSLVCKAALTESENESGIKNEYEIMKNLCHENIVQLQAASRGTFLFVLAMEKLSGIDVLTYLSLQHFYSEELVAKIVLQVLNALEYLHFKGICMLELQPDNVVMVNQRSPNIKLVDFANARFIPPTGAKVNVRGKSEYLAPELLKNEEASTASDVWGLAVLTYILLSGVSPFKAESEAETIENVTFVRYHFDQLHKEVTQEAIRFLMLIFKRTPEKRPTLEECDDHKWLMPNEFMLRKREAAVFSSERISEFADRFHAEKQSATPPKLLTVSGMQLSSE
ncbi:Muscle M-line assembly protein unc-89-like protein [Leptotrombidium deliense]|uniref:Muscle M-line assembly protein unc-89-like protein n=1 Tax=Leptotrombidium deliense TaxID=299467 RepID=A0A443SCU0_9ACAR|nr:Muscle M-line assembly protein unc-89-like protein [Leptotrombidium deliense]